MFGAIFGESEVTVTETTIAGPAHFKVAGAEQGLTTGATVPWPPHEEDDIALLYCETNNETVTLSTPAGFVELTGSPQNSGGAGTNNSRLTVFWCRATSDAMASPVVADPGDHLLVQMLVFPGAKVDSDPTALSTDTDATGTVDIVLPGGTTTEDHCLIVHLVASGFDGGATAWVSGQVNADLESLIEVSDIRTASGNGGALAAIVGHQLTAGAFGDTALTSTAAATYAMITIALEPEPSSGPTDVTPPVITEITPDDGQVRATTIIGFKVTDETGLSLVAILASFPDGTTEVVHDGDGFRGNYRDSVNTRTTISGGYRFAIRRAGGWTQNPTIEYLVLDAGNMGVIA